MAARAPALDEVRHWFAGDLRAICHLRDERVVAAFAAVRSAGRDPRDADDLSWLHCDNWCLSQHELH